MRVRANRFRTGVHLHAIHNWIRSKIAFSNALERCAITDTKNRCVSETASSAELDVPTPAPLISAIDAMVTDQDCSCSPGYAVLSVRIGARPRLPWGGRDA